MTGSAAGIFTFIIFAVVMFVVFVCVALGVGWFAWWMFGGGWVTFVLVALITGGLIWWLVKKFWWN